MPVSALVLHNAEEKMGISFGVNLGGIYCLKRLIFLRGIHQVHKQTCWSRGSAHKYIGS